MPSGGQPSTAPISDLELATEVDRFDFAMPVSREDGLPIARPARSREYA